MEKQYQHDFNERVAEDTEEMSREDALKLWKSVKLEDGHYSLKLPFKEKAVTMPNNRCVAQQRLTGVKRKMERDKKKKSTKSTQTFWKMLSTVAMPKKFHLMNCAVMKIMCLPPA